MSEEEKNKLRNICEREYRKMLYQDLKYKFMPALGMKNFIRGFSKLTTNECIGVLHLKWEVDENGKYDYHAKWYDNPEDGMEILLKLEKEKSYNHKLLYEAAIEHFNNIHKKPLDKNILLN